MAPASGSLWPMSWCKGDPDLKAVACLNPIEASMPRRRNSEGKMVDAGQLNALVEEATVDCYGQAEQALCLFTMIEAHLELPFQTRVLGLEVNVVAVEQSVDGSPIAVCRR